MTVLTLHQRLRAVLLTFALLTGCAPPAATAPVGDVPEDATITIVGFAAGNMTLLLSGLFEHYGFSLEEAASWGFQRESILISSADRVEALQSGSIDVGLSWSGIPGSHVPGISAGVRLLSIDDTGLGWTFLDLGCVSAVILMETYPFVRQDVPTVAEPHPLVARADLPDDVVYAIVTAVFNHADIVSAAYDGTA